MMQFCKRYCYVLLAIVFLAILAVPFLRKTDSQWDNVYLGAATRMMAGENVFRLQDGYLYPPFMAWLAIPFIYLSQDGARVAWFAINVISLILIWYVAWRLSGGTSLRQASWREHAIVGLGLLCALRFAVDCLQNQQTDLVVAALVLGGCWLLYRDQSWSAATLLGLAAGMKCTPLLFAPYLAYRARWGAAGWLVVLAVGVNLVPDGLGTVPRGKDLLLMQWVNNYLSLVTNKDHAPGVWGSALVLNQSWSGAAYRFFNTTWTWTNNGVQVAERAQGLTPVQLKLIVHGSGLLLVGLCAYAMGWRARGPVRTAAPADLRQPLEYSVILLLMVLLSPMSSKPHYATLILPAWVLARLAVANRHRFAAACLGLAIVAGLFSAKDLAGAHVATTAMWYGCVSASAFSLLIGCCVQLWSLRRTAAVPFVADVPVSLAA